MNGYAGKILRVDLTGRKILAIPTSRYEQWVGGHGMGSAIFFDLVKDKTIDGFDSRNIVTIMTSPLSGTLTPAAAGRTEVQGIGVQSYPIGWFTRSNFGGRFSSMLKYAGWDGIVIEGKADKPVWIDIRDSEVAIRDCAPLSLWGMETWACQEAIWNYVAGGKPYGGWMEPNGKDKGWTTQKPAVLTMGPAGENLSRMACLIHDAGHGSGQGGFGAVWGSKNLKAISVIGTGEIVVHDPKALFSARLQQQEKYAYKLECLQETRSRGDFQSPPVPNLVWGFTGISRPKEGQRPSACPGCHSGCRARYKTGLGNEAGCITTRFYFAAHSLDIQRKASDLLNRFGLNAHEMLFGLVYLEELNGKGILGPGKEIDCPLDFDDYGSLEFVEQFVRMISYRNDGKGKPHPFGNDLAEGFVRAAKRWGRLDGDLKTGLLPFPFWGLPVHGEKDPIAHLEWGYGSLLGDRDINEHDTDSMKWDVFIAISTGAEVPYTAEEFVRISTDKMVPFRDPLMLDYGTENMYSEHMAKWVSWHRYYTRFWKQSALYCDWHWPDFVNLYAPGKVGSTGEAEPKFLNAVTGKQFTFLDGIELGRKIWNLDHAIWTLQGRHRSMVHFADYLYTTLKRRGGLPQIFMPVQRKGHWDFEDTLERVFTKDGVEAFKTRFYQLQGWDVETGYPERTTLESMGLKYVADELEQKGKLGKARHAS